MIIDSYAVKASSQRSYLSVETTTLAVNKGLSASPAKESLKEPQDKVSISDSIKKMYEKLKDDSKKMLAQNTGAQAVTKAKNDPKLPSTPEELKIKLLEMMLELMTGKKIKLRMQQQDGNNGGQNRGAQMAGGASPQRSQGMNSLSFESFYYESEQVNYQAQGVVKTADGSMINLNINMSMSREFASYTNISMQSGQQCDPLVINYGGAAASLTNEKFDFDLTMDGKLDKLSVLGKGSGFLAIDLNGDGKINDGSELFGPQSGNGFDELRKYDEDKNGWIDEADSVFSKLLIWSRDKDGKDQLFTLKDLGIGAIYLGDVDTHFSMNDSGNNTNGVMRSTSFFLKDGGGAGTISHIDMMI